MISPTLETRITAARPSRAGAVPAAPWQLVALLGPRRGTAYDVREGRLVLGRSREADLQLATETASKRHALLLREGARVTLQDLGSRNGTRVRGRRLHAARPVALRDGDRIDLGAETFVFCAGAGAAREARLGTLVVDAREVGERVDDLLRGIRGA